MAQTVGQAMHAGVITCPPGTTLRSVAGILAEHLIHAVVVAREDVDAPLAVVTDRDVVFRHSRSELDDVTAAAAANAPAVTVREDVDLRQAAELMAHYGTSHVIVTERGGRRPIGVLSSLDVAAAVAAT
jgi:CBS domain-containing protein